MFERIRLFMYQLMFSQKRFQRSMNTKTLFTFPVEMIAQYCYIYDMHMYGIGDANWHSRKSVTQAMNEVGSLDLGNPESYRKFQRLTEIMAAFNEDTLNLMLKHTKNPDVIRAAVASGVIKKVECTCKQGDPETIILENVYTPSDVLETLWGSVTHLDYNMLLSVLTHPGCSEKTFRTFFEKAEVSLDLDAPVDASNSEDLKKAKEAWGYNEYMLRIFVSAKEISSEVKQQVESMLLPYIYYGNKFLFSTVALSRDSLATSWVSNNVKLEIMLTEYFPKHFYLYHMGIEYIESGDFKTDLRSKMMRDAEEFGFTEQDFLTAEMLSTAIWGEDSPQLRYLNDGLYDKTLNMKTVKEW